MRQRPEREERTVYSLSLKVFVLLQVENKGSDCISSVIFPKKKKQGNRGLNWIHHEVKGALFEFSPGSDDAVPPRFSIEDLGHGDPGLDRGVTIRHTEGIYSKRLKTATVRMPEHRGEPNIHTNSMHPHSQRISSAVPRDIGKQASSGHNVLNKVRH